MKVRVLVVAVVLLGTAAAGAEYFQQQSFLSASYYSAGPISVRNINGVTKFAINGRTIDLQHAKLISEDAKTRTLRPLEVPEATIRIPKTRKDVIIDYRGFHFESIDNVPDECPKCGEKKIDCVCSTMALTEGSPDKYEATAVENPPKTSPMLNDPPSDDFPKANAASNTLTVDNTELSPNRELTSSYEIIKPRVGHPKHLEHGLRDRYDWEEIEDPVRYTLPPVDQNLYDVQHSQTSNEPQPLPLTKKRHKKPSNKPERLTPEVAKEVIDDNDKPKTSDDTPDENFYLRRGCWCKDCPWLIAYAIVILIWLALMAFMSFNEQLEYGSSKLLDDNQCTLLCSNLVAPSRPLDELQTTSSLFHCSKFEKWEGDIFRPWRSKVDPNGNPNCVQDCKGFETINDFIHNCVKRENAPPEGRPFISSVHPAKSLLFLDRIKGHWYWILHIILITNAISLFILLVPLFFCCPMVAGFVFASVLASLILTILLWWETGRTIGRHDEKQSWIISMWIYTVCSTLFSVYVIFNAFLIFKRFRVICAVVGLASRVVSAVPTILLEAVLTMVLLLAVMVTLIFLCIGIEAGAPVEISGSTYAQYASPLIWFARVFTMIVAYWTAQMLINCQTIIIHGAMARYYFEKNMKNKVLQSHKRLIKYHVCTACFAGLLFNWLYWIRWFRKKTSIRSKSLFGTGMFGLCFCPASKVVKKLVFIDPTISKKIDKANPYFFLVHVLVVLIIGSVCRIVFKNAYVTTLSLDLISLAYAYFVSMSAVNVFRVSKDAMFLCYGEDKTLTSGNPERNMKMPHPVSVFFGYEPRVSPR